MIVKTKIIMDLLKPTLCPVINAVQGDTYSRGIDISLFAAGVAWEIPDDVTAAVRYRKSDGTKGYYDTLPDGSAAWSAANNVLTVLFAPQMLTVAGPVVTQIEMIQGAKVLATFSMRLFVEENPAAGVLESEDYINWLQWMEAELDAYLEKAKVNGEYVGGKMLGPINMDGNPISGLNAPTEETQAANKGYVDGAVKKAAPRSLMANSNFRNPVNQRSYVNGTTVNGYFIDWWIASSGAFNLSSDGIEITAGQMNQRIPLTLFEDGKTYTLACKVDGDILCYSGVKGTTIGSWDSGLVAAFEPDYGICIVYLTKVGSKYEWVALYEGEYTAETLPEYQPKGYGAELTECQRYLFRQYMGDSFFTGRVFSSDPTKVDLVIPLPAVMVDKYPSFTRDGVCSIWYDGLRHTSCEIVSCVVRGNFAFLVMQCASELSASRECLVRFEGGYLTLSAEFV